MDGRPSKVTPQACCGILEDSGALQPKQFETLQQGQNSISLVNAYAAGGKYINRTLLAWTWLPAKATGLLGGSPGPPTAPDLTQRLPYPAPSLALLQILT